MRRILSIIVLPVLFLSCGPSVYVDKSWRDPEVTVDGNKLNKVLVVAFMKNEASSRYAQDKLVGLLKGKGVAAYQYLPQGIKQEDRDKIKEQLKNDGFDGAIIMKLVDVDKDITYVPGSYTSYPFYYRDFWGYYWNSFSSTAATYSPGYYETTKTYSLEINVYGLRRDRLVWTGLTTYADPENATKLVEGSAKTAFKEMRKQGFLTN